MMHDVWFHGFHGSRTIRFRGPEAGFLLSPAQARRWRAAICPYAGCLCWEVVPLEFSAAGASILPTEDGYRLRPAL